MKRLYFLFLLFSFHSFAQQRSADWQADSVFIHSIANTIMSSQAAYNNLYQLTKNIGGRLAGSPQMVKAEQWGYKAMKDAGAENVIMQQCMVPHWVRGGKDKTIISYKDKNGKEQSFEINVLALGNSAGSGAAGVKAPLVMGLWRSIAVNPPTVGRSFRDPWRLPSRKLSRADRAPFSPAPSHAMCQEECGIERQTLLESSQVHRGVP